MGKSNPFSSLLEQQDQKAPRKQPADKLLSYQKSLRLETEKLDVLSSQVHLMQQ